MQESRARLFGGVSPWPLCSVLSILILLTTQPFGQAQVTQAENETQDAIGGALFVAGNFLYVAAWGHGIQVLDISTPAKPRWAGAWNHRGSPTGVYVLDNSAYVANRPHGLDVLDVHNPRNPVHLANLPTGGDSMGVYVKGRFAYLADAIRVSGDKPYSYMPKGDKALKVIDIEDPTHPQLIESQMSPGDSQTATPVGELARVVNLHRMVYEITPQTAPIPALIQMHVIAGGLFGFDMVGSFAYSYWDGGLAIYDVRDPGSPKKISVFKTGSGIWDVRVAGKHAYVMDSHASIHVLDVSDPAKPLELAQFKCTGYVSRWIALQPLITNVTGTNLSTAPKLPAPKLAPIDTEPPQLVNERRLPDGSFEFTLVGVANGNYIIQYTVDWSGWTSLSTNSLPANGHATIADPHAAEATQRYYRAVKQ